MYAASDAVKNKFKAPVQQHFIRGNIGSVPFNGTNIVKGSMSWENSCAHDDTMIGTVYIGSFSCTFMDVNVARGDWYGKKITVEFGISLGETVEWVPCGEWYVSEAMHDTDGVRVTAYDAMSKLDEPLGLSTTQGTCYDFLGIVIANTGVPLGMTEAECRALSNGDQILTLDPEHTLETKRDMLSKVAEYTGTYATIDRSGVLVLRQYQTDPIDTLTTTHRLVGAEFSDFQTYYSGISVAIKGDESTHYYGDLEDDTGLTYNLGTNPFLQDLNATRLESIMRRILAELEKIRYTPFGSDIIDNPLYDLGDVITFTDGFASTSKCCVMSYEVQVHNATALDGFGSNPALVNVKSKTDKNIAGLMAETKADKIQYYTYTNADDITITDAHEKSIISIRFLTLSSAHVTFQAEIALETDCEDEMLCTVRYRKNGVLQEYQPKERWIDGKHILSLFMPMDVEPNSVYTWVVYLRAGGGSLTIPERSVQAMIWGQGLVSTGSWDGFIEVREYIPKVSLTGTLGIRPFAGSTTADVQIPLASMATARIKKLALDSVGVRPFREVAAVGKDLVSAHTWTEIAENTWAELEDGFIWG